MKRIANNLATGRVCAANVSLAVFGIGLILLLEGWDQAIAGCLTGAYFFTQALLALRDIRKKGAG